MAPNPMAPETAMTGEAGVAVVAKIILRDLKWLFRQLPTLDFGVDGLLEMRNESQATGRLIGLQIKTGASYFEHADDTHYFVHVRLEHVDYWSSYSVAVLLVIVDERSERAWWTAIDESSVTRFDKGAKVRIPKKNELVPSSRWALQSLASHATGYDAALAELQVARDWIRHLAAGHGLRADVHLWVNKSSRRRDVILYRLDERGQERKLVDWSVMGGSGSPVDAVTRLFPWADWEFDSDRHDLDEYDDGDRDESEFPEPYEELGGEVEVWSLVASLSDLGKSFMIVDQHLMSTARW